jgi:hypothetical protein
VLGLGGVAKGGAPESNSRVEDTARPDRPSHVVEWFSKGNSSPTITFFVAFAWCSL